MMKQKIKFMPCPFCGETVSLCIDREKTFYESQRGTGEASLRISCLECGVDMWEDTFCIHDYEKRLELLAKKWNTRVDNIDMPL